MLTKRSCTERASHPAIDACTGKSFSWSREIQQLLSPKIFNIFWWPLFKYHQRYLTESAFFRYCKTLPGFSGLWSTIQKGSFAYNNLFLGIKPYQKLSSLTNLADITTLALFFGDEFIDGLCETAGKYNILEVVNKNHEQFYLQSKSLNGRITLEYRFNLNELLPDSLMQEVNCKYEISYRKFYSLLQYFLLLMNHHLSFMPLNKAESAAQKIIAVCNSCLDSYFHDVNSKPVNEKIHTVNEVLHFHEVKTRSMQEKLLDLRCTLVDKEYLMKGDELKGWLEVMSVVQIIDDLEDAPEDDGLQDNLVISAAFHYFPPEWNLFCIHKSLLQKTKNRHLLLSLYMPQTICYCLQLAAKKIQFMNWEQQKIMHYLLFKNWFTNNKDDAEILPFESRQVFMPLANEETVKSYIVDLCFHLQNGRKWIRRKIGWTKYYQLRYNLLSVSGSEKAALFNKITKEKTIEQKPAILFHGNKVA